VARDELAIAWQLLASTGMRRGEALALRWGDVDLDAGRLSVRRSATVVEVKGEGERIIVGPPKSGKPRTVDLDPDTAAGLRTHKAAQGTLSLSLAREDAYVFASLDGTVRHPERFSRKFAAAVEQARAAGGQKSLAKIRLHDLRHTHADAAPRGRCARQGRLGTPGARQRDHHTRRLRSRHAGHAAGGGCEVRGTDGRGGNG
jgi:integrase